MQSAHSSPGNEPDSVNSGALSLILGLVAASTLAVALVVTALVRDEVKELSGVRDQTQDAPFRQLKASQMGALEAPAQYKDRGQGVVSVPIGRAMAMTLEAVRRNPAALSPWTPQPEPARAETLPAEGAPAEAPSEDGVKTAADRAPGDASSAKPEAKSAPAPDATTGAAPASSAPAPALPAPASPAHP